MPEGHTGREPSLRFRHVAKSVGVPLLHRCGALWLESRLLGGERQIALNYHNVDADVFSRHLAYLRRHTVLVDLDTFLTAGAMSRNRPVVTITFDDGYASFVHEIVPIVTALEVPVAWFVPTAVVGTDEVFWFNRVRARILHSHRERFEFGGRQWHLESWNREYVAAAIGRLLKQQPDGARERSIRMLAAQLDEAPRAVLDRFRHVTPDQLQSLDPALVTVGSHSHTHPQLSQLNGNDLTRELVLSKQLLEGWMQRPVRHFAFPSGDYAEGTLQGVRAAGYVSGWTTEARFRVPADDCHRMPRIPIDDRAPVGVLAAKMSAGLQRWSAWT